MKCSEIHLRDPFILFEDGVYYLYGTRARNFGIRTGGFDVYTSTDMENWSQPHPVFDSERFGLNLAANWAPEVHKYQGAYYMFATFVQPEDNLRGSYILKADSPLGPFLPHSRGAATPRGWECLDGTLHIDAEGKPFLVFCHEHTQIIDGAICCLPLSDDLTEAAGEPVTLFHASEPWWADPDKPGEHRVTDGPFLHRTENGNLLMLWSTFLKGNYAQCLVSFRDGRLGTEFTHLPPISAEDGGHGMIFRCPKGLFLVYHFPNTLEKERPSFFPIRETEDGLAFTDR